MAEQLNKLKAIKFSHLTIEQRAQSGSPQKAGEGYLGILVVWGEGVLLDSEKYI